MNPTRTAFDPLPLAREAGLDAACAERLEKSYAQWGNSEVFADALAQLDRLHADAEIRVTALLGLADETPEGWPAPLVALLEGLTAERQVRVLHAEQGLKRDGEGLRRLLLAMSSDLRVVPVMLALQLAKLRDAIRRESEDAEELARITRDIHAPLANRLGIWQLKWELEDLAFRVLEPEAYRRIARLMDDNRRGRESYIETVRAQLQNAIAAHGIAGDVVGRPKHLYSIWRKMQKKNLPFEGLFDLRALRVLVDDVAQCYSVLGVVHATWAPVPGEFDDYIARPKANDYRSLHTAVVGPEGKTFEVQIRTHEMHRHAELGVAAHWAYKEGGGRGDAGLVRKVAWMRQLLEQTASDTASQAPLADQLQSELVEERIYVLTPKGAVFDLPQGATPIDFAYRVHTDVGHRCRGAKVDGRIVPLNYTLQTGERVEIMTAKVAEPRRDWLQAGNGFLASGRSREKVRTWFRRFERERNLLAGQDLLAKELRRAGVGEADLLPLLPKLKIEDLDELRVQLALGEVGTQQVSRLLNEAQKPQAAAEPEPAPAPARTQAVRRAGVTVGGIDNLLTHLARCCQPLPGEPITGYLTKTRGISVHRADCAALARIQRNEPARLLDAEWGASVPKQEVDLSVLGRESKWLSRDVANVFAQDGVPVAGLHVQPHGRSGQVKLRVRLRLGDHAELQRLTRKLADVPGVIEVRRSS